MSTDPSSPAMKSGCLMLGFTRWRRAAATRLNQFAHRGSCFIILQQPVEPILQRFTQRSPPATAPFKGGRRANRGSRLPTVAQPINRRPPGLTATATAGLWAEEQDHLAGRINADQGPLNGSHT